MHPVALWRDATGERWNPPVKRVWRRIYAIVGSVINLFYFTAQPSRELSVLECLVAIDVCPHDQARRALRNQVEQAHGIGHVIQNPASDADIKGLDFRLEVLVDIATQE